ncbi:MAG: histone deacetylase [Elusimicrobia bacterium]|nr:histone deacetylase [Elusimicrobiota bacterium]
MARVFTDPVVTEYEAPGHPEAPFRVERTAERLEAAGHALEAPPEKALDDDLLRAHLPEHLLSVREGSFDDPDTPAYPGIDGIARVSASGAVSAMRAALTGEPAFSLMRPPGHHAAKARVSGFCFYNNVVVAVLRALREKGTARAAILDVDVHHGDGTESLVHGNEAVRFCSLHQAPLYPGTGLTSRDNCRNIPLPPGTGPDAYLRKLEPALQDLVDFKPDLLAVSAGFDTFADDPIAQLKLDRRSYRRIGRLCAQTGLPRFAVLEGGYAQELPVLVEEFLEGFFT